MSFHRGVYRFHVAPGREDRLKEALDENMIMIGWSEAEGLLDCGISNQERKNIIHDTYYFDELDQRKAGHAAGCMKRFICEMDIDDYVLVSVLGHRYFYTAKVIPFDEEESDTFVGDDKVRYYFNKVKEGTAYRRKVSWAKKVKDGIPWKLSHKELAKNIRQKFYIETTILDISDHIDEIKKVIQKHHLIFDEK